MKTKSIFKIICGLAAGIFISNTASAQFSVTGQYMSRGEYRHGYSTLADTVARNPLNWESKPVNQKPSLFVSQRARLNGEYKQDKYRIFVSAQDVRTWGSASHLTIDTKGFFSIYEAYGELYFTKKFSAKIGRQAIAYDDERIFGSLDWAMQGRRHDAGVFKYTDSTLQVHVGGAYNQNTESNLFRQYTVAGNYQSFQYLWANKLYKKFNFSFLFLNNGYAYNRVNSITGVKDSMTLYSQTFGLRAEYKSDKIVGLVYGYYQMGDDASNKVMSAFNACAEVGYKPTKEMLVSLGGEIISGQSQTDTAKAYRDVNHSFNPFYGTNHRFNGYMDYFYVGNHINSVGLIDGYLRLSYTHKKVLTSLNAHTFMSAADIKDTRITTSIESLSPNLGSEIDFTLSYNFTDGVAVQSGYSQIFGTHSLKAIKGGQISTTSNWAYVMLIIRPGKVKWPKTGLKM